MQHKHALILLISIATGVVIGIFCGWFWGKTMLKFAWLGELFMNALKMMIIPLIISAVISGIA
jgi:Na+/H+-dicarboxylate symporter